MNVRMVTCLGLAAVACLGVGVARAQKADGALVREMKFVRVPKGTFWMGWDSNQKKSTQVTIDQDFEIAAYCVTQAQWEAVMGNNPSCYSRKGRRSQDVEKVPVDELRRFPVDSVSWNDVQEFLKRLNAREKGKGWTYRLPTEAEWEYACRGAPTTKADCEWDFYVGKRRTNDLSSKEANFDGNYPAGAAAKGPFLGRPAAVGSYPANPLGLFDMHGNIGQWCDDEWPAAKTARLIRGNCADCRSPNSGYHCRTALRACSDRSSQIAEVGFRVARAPTTGKE